MSNLQLQLRQPEIPFVACLLAHSRFLWTGNYALSATLQAPDWSAKRVMKLFIIPSAFVIQVLVSSSFLFCVDACDRNALQVLWNTKRRGAAQLVRKLERSLPSTRSLDSGHAYDSPVVGAGGPGARAAMGLAESGITLAPRLARALHT